jgi:hypothetical protein
MNRWKFDALEFAVTAGAIIILILCAVRPMVQPASDFLGFYAGGKLLGPGLYSVVDAVAIGEEIAPGRQTADAPIWYVTRPPFYYAPFAALSRLTYFDAAAIWVVVNIASLAMFLLLWPTNRIGGVLYSAFFFPLLNALIVGQDCLPLLAMVAVAVVFHRSGREVLAGVVLGLCVAAKPSTLLFLPLIAIAVRSWKMTAGITAAWAFAYAASAAIMVDWSWPVSYARYLFFVAPHSRAIPLWCIPLATGALVWWCKGKQPEVAVAILLSAGVLLTPRAFYYDLTFLSPFLLLLLTRKPSMTAVLYAFPLIAVITLYYVNSNGVRVLVAGLLLGGMYLFRVRAIPGAQQDPVRAAG